MNLAGFEKIAKYLAVPLVLVGFVLMLVFGIHSELIKSGLLPQVSQEDAGVIIKLMLQYGFRLGLCVTVLGFILAAWNKYMDNKTQVQQVNIDLLAEKVAAKVLAKMSPSEPGRKEAKKAVIEAVTALPKVDAPASSINNALQELEQGHTAKAQAIFTGVLRKKEVEGCTSDKEAAAAARHLGALTYMNNPKEALLAYHKAVELDPDNPNSWNMLGQLLARTGELAQAEDAYCKALTLAEGYQDNEEQAAAYANLGIVYETRGELDQSEQMYRKSLEISEALGLKELTANQYGNLGLVYKIRGDLDRAEQMYRKSLEISEALGLKELTANQYGNIGNVYYISGDLHLAEQMHRKSLALHEALGRSQGMANQYGNLGNVYHTRGDLHLAEQMHRKALMLHEALGYKEGIAVTCINLGNVYKTCGDLYLAEQMYRNALKVHEDLGNREGIAVAYGNLGNVYETRDELEQAEQMYRKALVAHEVLGRKKGMAIWAMCI